MSRSSPMHARCAILMVLLVGGLEQSRAQDTSTLLTDKIYQGSGVIDLLKNISAGSLASYLQASSGLLLAVDVNENASGNESSTSLGVAIKSVTLRLQTTAGDFSFSNVFTNTTAILKDTTGVTAEYYTLFGQAGSSQLTSSTSGFNLSSFDDLLEVRNVMFSGDIVSAKLAVNFVSTALKAGANESFFDFSGGFEDFALISRIDAKAIESAAIGVAAAPTGITYEAVPISETILAPVVTTAPTTTTTTTTATTTTESTTITAAVTTSSPVVEVASPAVSAPAAPLPPAVFVAAAALLLMFKMHRKTPKTA